MRLQNVMIWSMCAAALGVSAQVASAQQESVQPVHPSQKPFSLVFEKGLVRATIRDQPLSVVLDEFAARCQLNITVADGIDAPNVTAELNNERLGDALLRLLANYDVFYYYAGTGELPATLRAVWVYAKGTSSTVRPVPPEAWAGTKELVTGIGNTDPAVRERAYEALMSQPDLGSRDLVIGALRSSGERDDGLRERLLSRAVANGSPIGADILADLARADSSEQIRWIALDALAQDSVAVKPAAEAALTDASEAVRSRAKEILAELGGAAARAVTGSRGPEAQPHP